MDEFDPEAEISDLTDLFPLEPDSPDDLATPIVMPFVDSDGEEYYVDLVPALMELFIVEKSLELTKLQDIIHPAQIAIINKVNECINNQRPCRIIVLKARQIGMSTIIEGLLFLLAFMLERLRGLVIAHEMGSSEHLLSMSQNYYDTFWAKDAYTQKNKSSKVLSWTETKSQIGVSTARNMQSARGRTVHFLHGSEVGFWDNADVLMTGLAQAIPMLPLTFVFLESTANGIGNYFHTTWESACSGELDYIPMFFPWYTHPEYLASNLNLPIITGPLDAEERQLYATMQDPPKERWNDFQSTPLTHDQIMDRLTWRRYAIRNLCKSDLNKFHQEYPTDPNEAFISTGTNIFPKTALDKTYMHETGVRGFIFREGERVRWSSNIEGPFTIFKKPSVGQEYIVAGDPTRATQGDFASIQVLNRRTWEQVAVYRQKVDPVTFGEDLMNVGMYYNTALLVSEIEGGGSGTIAVVQDRGYPRIWQHEKAETMPGQIDNTFGWHTNWRTKNQALGNLKKAIVDGMLVFHDRTTYNELKNYVALPGNKYGNGDGEAHDDTVMAFAIGITVILYTAMEIGPIETDVIRAINTPKLTAAPSDQPTIKTRQQQLEDPAPEDVTDEPVWMKWDSDE